jgi:hypothetical protein
VGYIGNDVILLPNRSCFENVALPMRIAGNSNEEIQARVSAALTRVGLAKAAPLANQALQPCLESTRPMAAEAPSTSGTARRSRLSATHSPRRASSQAIAAAFTQAEATVAVRALTARERLQWGWRQTPAWLQWLFVAGAVLAVAAAACAPLGALRLEQQEVEEEAECRAREVHAVFFPVWLLLPSAATAAEEELAEDRVLGVEFPRSRGQALALGRAQERAALTIKGEDP